MDNDLISRSERLRQIRQTEPDDYRSAMLISDAKKMIRAFIEKAPAVDAVEVVRCKNCKHWNKDALACDTLPWVNSSEHVNWYAEDFCSYGEKRNGEHD